MISVNNSKSRSIRNYETYDTPDTEEPVDELLSVC
jgi:hypothetical protein